jgi:hypothetical protein
MTSVTQLCPICKKTTISEPEMYCAGCVGTPEAKKIVKRKKSHSKYHS